MKMKEVKSDQLKVYIYETRKAMGEAAGKEAAGLINQIIREKGEANVIFAAAPSQNDLLAQLLEEAVDWTRSAASNRSTTAASPALTRCPHTPLP